MAILILIDLMDLDETFVISFTKAANVKTINILLNMFIGHVRTFDDTDMQYLSLVALLSKCAGLLPRSDGKVKLATSDATISHQFFLLREAVLVQNLDYCVQCLKIFNYLVEVFPKWRASIDGKSCQTLLHLIRDCSRLSGGNAQDVMGLTIDLLISIYSFSAQSDEKARAISLSLLT